MLNPLSFPRMAAVAASSCLPLLAAAQEAPVQKLAPVVITPSRIAQVERDVLGDVTVIDRETLARSGQDSLAEILGRESGFSVYSSGGPQTQTSVFLRGTNPQQTLVLIDGMRVNSISSNAVNWNAIDPAALERVEIVRGAASSLYGSNAIGGVINLITRKPGRDQPTAAWMNFGAGTYDTMKTGVGFSGSGKSVDYALSASVANSTGFSATSRSNTYGEYFGDSDGYSQHSVSGSLGYQWAQGQRLDATLYNGYIDGQFDAGQYSPVAQSQTRQQAYSVSSTNQLTSAWQSVLRLGFSKETALSRSFDSDYTFGNLSRNYSWQNNLQLSRNHTVSLVLERLEERTAPGSTNYTSNARNTNAAGLIYRGKAGVHHIQASLRNDNISGYGNQLTGGLSYELELDSNWRAGIAANTGFRAPTFADLYSAETGYYVGNPNLKPERSRNIEASLTYETETSTASATVFQNKLRDMINSYVYDQTLGLSTARNIDRATLRGISLKAEKRFNTTTLRAGADFLDPRNDTPSTTAANNQLPFRARQVYRLSALQYVGALELGAEYQFTGKRYNDTNNTQQLGGYALANVTASYPLSRHASVQLRWNNIFNKDYVTTMGYQTPGSNVFINLSLQM